MLTDKAVRALRPAAAAYKRADGRNLYLHVTPGGAKSWRMRFRDSAGREQTLTFGLWPEVSLDDARARRDQACDRLARGEDPRVAPIAPAIPATFEAAARAWHAHRLEGWSAVHARDVLQSLERDVFPAIGALPLGDVTRPIVLRLLRAIEARGARETAQRVCKRIVLTFAFARAEGWTDAQDLADVSEGLRYRGGRSRQRAVTDAAELRTLLAAIAELPAAPIARLASRLLALTAVRLACVRAMRWAEVEDLDGSDPRWRIPAAQMKLGVARKSDAANDHVVPLSRATAAVLRAAWAIASRRDDGGFEAPAPDALVFPGAGGEPLGKGALGELIDRAGFAGRHCPHGWRAAFATIMREARPDQARLIDLTLAHTPKDKVAAAYDRAQLLADRRDLLQRWADMILPPLVPEVAA